MEQQQLLGSSNNDAESRKKRDSRAVKAERREEKVNDDGASSDHGPEQSKKLRAERTTPAASSSPPAPQHQPENLDPSNRRRLDPEAVTDEQEIGAHVAVGVTDGAHVLDLEVALQRIVGMNQNSITRGSPPSQQAEEDGSTKEFLSQECWVTFRVGHAGDASALAGWYQISQEQNANVAVKDRNNGEEYTSMEVRLAEGLGDEDTPPAIFALIADISFHSNNGKGENKAMMGAAALLSIIREEPRVLNVEWLHVSEDGKLTAVSSLLRRRMWLRLSALALMTCCTTLVAPSKIRQEVSDANGKQATAAVDQQRSDTSSDRL